MGKRAFGVIYEVVRFIHFDAFFCGLRAGTNGRKVEREWSHKDYANGLEI
jgi:hypothetical protein